MPLNKLASFFNRLTGRKSESVDLDSDRASSKKSKTPTKLSSGAEKQPGGLDQLITLAAASNIEIVYTSSQSEGKVTHKAPPRRNLSGVCNMLHQELLLYPEAILRASRLQRIVLGAHLQHEKEPVGGLCLADKGTFYLAVESFFIDPHTRRSFHHEFFHCIDFNDDIYHYYDPAWAALNEAAFHYSPQKFKRTNSGIVPRMGFISHYAMSHVHEDKAELYSHMICHYQAVMARAQSDTVLLKKCQFLKALLRRFAPEFNDNFWETCRKKSAPLDNGSTEDGDSIAITVRIWGEHIRGSAAEIWFIGRPKENYITPLAYYSRQDLIDCLNRLEIADFDEVSNLRIGPKYEFRAIVSRRVINDLRLY